MKVWSADELRGLLESIEYSHWYVPIFLTANTGMRRGEVRGLTWRDVDSTPPDSRFASKFSPSVNNSKLPT